MILNFPRHKEFHNSPCQILGIGGSVNTLCKLFWEAINKPNLRINSLSPYIKTSALCKSFYFYIIRLLHGLPKIIVCLLYGQVSIKNLIFGAGKDRIVN